MQEKLIHSIVWKFQKKNPNIPYDELYSEAALAYCEATSRFDPARGIKKTTVAYTYMSRALQNLCNTQYQRENLFQEIEETSATVPFFPPISELLDGLSEDGQIICHMILSAPEDFIGAPPKMIRGKIYQSLRKAGWSWPNIWAAFAEVKTALNEN